jgi:hypothetical protein
VPALVKGMSGGGSTHLGASASLTYRLLTVTPDPLPTQVNYTSSGGSIEVPLPAIGSALIQNIAIDARVHFPVGDGPFTNSPVTQKSFTIRRRLPPPALSSTPPFVEAPSQDQFSQQVETVCTPGESDAPKCTVTITCAPHPWNPGDPDRITAVTARWHAEYLGPAPPLYGGPVGQQWQGLKASPARITINGGRYRVRASCLAPPWPER